ncbi:YjjI family glycine radical enzyme [Clostridium sp. PL3]|uniref:YjjI family glycine radical enzyme n=1 Tax=Clostridium thailandense TaxID=2794346 RepID=A0A949TW34_9CLOT|nr:YjjI family glycine radical enzyme [Clostridium thailandense]MBV7273533.1 YjjI family glycine radical enzyme [Clostridium thailandense]
MENILKVVKDKTLTYEQKVLTLAHEAEATLNVLNISSEVQQLRDEGIICDLNEGNAPYRPRYIVPDYEKFMKQGSEFLGLESAKDIWEATNNLLILYKHVPSVTSMPVYIGNIDTLLDPFIEDEKEAYKAIKLFLLHIDRTITDSFCHANIGPMETKAGRIILKVQRELQTAIPNITLKYSKNTPEDFAIDAVSTALVTAKPSFANDEIFSKEFDKYKSYGIASCYNGLYIGGGSYTLVRLNLAALAKKASDKEEFINKILPDTMLKMSDYMDERIKFIVEESSFFESNFLVKERLISRDRFTAMFGMFGLAECVNTLLKAEEQKDRFGHSEEANKLGITIIEKMYEVVNNRTNSYCEVTEGHFLLHAQVGIETDKGTSPGCRIPIGEEPELYIHLTQSAKFHKYFPSGIGDIFPFETTAKNNPKAVLDIVKGAFKEDMRYFSLYSADSDVIRITGYLVKRSDIEKLDRGEQVLQDTVALGLGAVKNSRVLERKVRKDA